MRIIHTFRNRNSHCNSYPSRWFDPSCWYNAGRITGYVLQFLAGIGIGYVVASVVRGVIIGLGIL